MFCELQDIIEFLDIVLHVHAYMNKTRKSKRKFELQYVIEFLNRVIHIYDYINKAIHFF